MWSLSNFCKISVQTLANVTLFREHPVNINVCQFDFLSLSVMQLGRHSSQGFVELATQKMLLFSCIKRGGSFFLLCGLHIFLTLNYFFL